MPTYTITEALANLKTIEARRQKKMAYLMPHIMRAEGVTLGPLSQVGTPILIQEALGSVAVVRRTIAILGGFISRQGEALSSPMSGRVGG